MPSLSLTGGTGQFTWNINSLSGSFNRTYYIRAGITAYRFTVGGVTSISGIVDSVSAPTYGTSTSTSRRTVNYSAGTYTFWAWAQTKDGKYWPAGSASVTVSSSGSGGGGVVTPPTPNPPVSYGSLWSTSVTTSSISVQFTQISRATSYQVAFRRSDETMPQYITTTYLGFTFNYLSADTSYVINYRGINSDGYGPFMPNGVTIRTLKARPSNWSWWSSIYQGGTISISASEWNAFCTRINEFREYKGLPKYGQFPYVYSGTVISASIVDHAVYAIGAMNSSALSYDVRSGDYITASFFNGLKNCLNAIS